MPDNTIHEKRLRKKMTKLDLSVRSGVTNPLIARLESGKQLYKNISYVRAKGIADVLGYPVEEVAVMDSDYVYMPRSKDLVGSGGSYPVVVGEVDNKLSGILSERGISLNEFADSLKMSRTTVRNLLSGKSSLESMSLCDVYRIADYLKMDPEDLFIRKDDQPSRVRELREERHLTVEELAKLAGMSYVTAAHIDSNAQKLGESPYPHVLRLARVLGADENELLDSEQYKAFPSRHFPRGEDDDVKDVSEDCDNRLAELVTRREMSYTELAKKAGGLSKGKLMKIAKGELDLSAVSAGSVYRLADALGVHPHELFRDLSESRDKRTRGLHAGRVVRPGIAPFKKGGTK